MYQAIKLKFNFNLYIKNFNIKIKNNLINKFKLIFLIF